MTNEEMIAEFKKCKNDPIHFICTYVKVIHPVRGLVPFKLYPFQKFIVQEFLNNRFNILRKFRQAGCTTLVAALSLWFSIFNKHKTVAILSKGDTESTELLERIKVMYDELPEFLQPEILEKNKHTLKLGTLSVIKSRPSGKQSGRSLAGSLLIIDEAAFIENIDTIWAAVYPIISTGGKVFVLSTVNGVGNWYHTVYTEAETKENEFNIIDINWKDHPEYKRQEGEEFEALYEELAAKGINIDTWEVTTKANLPLKQWLQEYECSFLGTGDTYIDGEVLLQLKENISDQYTIKYNNRMRVWQEPDTAYTYVLMCDAALGRGRDFSAFHIINAYNGQQVAEFYSNRTPINEFAEIIAREGRLYNTAYVVPERNTIGNNLIDWLFNIYEYENIWMDEKSEFGFQVTAKNRETILAGMEEAVRTNLVKLNSSRTVNELTTFIFTENGKIEADKGKNDDLIMCLAIGTHVFKDLIETTPMEHINKIPYKDYPMMISNNSKGVSKALGGMSKEDYKWLLE